MSNIFENDNNQNVLNDSNDNGSDNQTQPEQGSKEEIAVVYNNKTWKQEDIINKFKNADEYIEQLKREKEELENRVKAEQNIEKLLKDATQNNVNEQLDSSSDTPTVDNNGLDIESVVYEVLTKKEQERAVSQNLEKLSESLINKYGDKANDYLKTKAQELNMTIEEAKTIAGTNPAVFTKLFLDDNKSNVSAVDHSTINTNALNKINSTSDGVGITRRTQGKELVEKLAKIASEVAKK